MPLIRRRSRKKSILNLRGRAGRALFTALIAAVTLTLGTLVPAPTFRRLRAIEDPPKFLVFRGFLPGQGIGQSMNGLLAAQLLANEFDRILCVSWKDFAVGMEHLQADSIQYCPKVLAQESVWREDRDHHATLVDYLQPPNECRLRDLLQSNATTVTLHANTYPRWPTVPTNFLEQYFGPTPEVQALLPSDVSTVVHLRVPDNVQGDTRPGLDDASLTALEHHLKDDQVYLITNQVQFYKRFSTWHNQGWSEVEHSALGKTWSNEKVENVPQQTHEDLLTQTWADWWTLERASSVFHTPSDFSASAMHWSDTTSHVLKGVDVAGEIVLEKESWERDLLVEPLSTRTDLLHCDSKTPYLYISSS